MVPLRKENGEIMDYTKKIISQSNYWYNDGLKKAKIRDMSGAILSLRRSLQYNAGNIAARNLLGLVYYGIGEVAEALVEWIISKNFRPRDNAANGYIRNIQNSARELEVIDQAVKKYNQALEYCMQNGEDLAIVQLKQVVSSHPSFLKGHQLLALLYLHTEQYAKAQQILAKAKKLDTTNETTLRYMQELSKLRGKKAKKSQSKKSQGQKKEQESRKKRKKKEAIEYKLGNETIIQPAQRIAKELAGKFTVMNIVLGILIGAAVVWFLIVPAADKTKTDALNAQILEFSERINALEAQNSALTRTLDGYRADSADTEAAAQTAASTSDSYENLIIAMEQYESDSYSDETMADTLMKINRSSLGEGALERYEEMTSVVFPSACSSLYEAGVESLNVANYDTAIGNLTKVVQMDESYEDGGALLNLGLAHLRNGDSEAATSYLKRVNELFPDTENAQEAKTNLETIAQEASDNTEE